MSEAKFTPGPWEAHTTTHNWYPCEWGATKVSKQTESYAVIAPGKTNEETVLVCEINDSDRNPWGPPADGLACAKLIAAAPDMLAMLEETATFLEQRAGVVSLLGRTVGADAIEEAAKLRTKALALRQLAAKVQGK